MPKTIRLTGCDLPLDPRRVTLVLGPRASAQAALGAGWINRRLATFGGTPLPIRRTDDAEQPGGTRLVIGTREDNPLVRAAAERGEVGVGPGDPGPRGYEIRRPGDGETVYLAGVDPVGALYACVTLGELLEMRAGGPPVWRAAEVRDWPDYLCVAVRGRIVPRAEVPREAYLADLEALYADMLRLKESALRWSFGSTKQRLNLDKLRAMPPDLKETVRLGMDLGARYGIAALAYTLSEPYAGLRDEYPDVGPEHELQGSAFDTAKGAARAKGDRLSRWYRSWSLPDAMARATAREVAAHAKALGFTDIAFHDTDTGGYSNPAEWEKRSAADRARWGDDYAAATIHRHRFYYEALKEAIPHCRVHFTLYPYGITLFDESRTAGSRGDRRRLDSLTESEAAAQQAAWRARYAEFWKRLDAAFPKDDVTFCARENTPAAYRRYRALMPGRGLLHWYGVRAMRLYANLLIEGYSGDDVLAANPRDVFANFSLIGGGDVTASRIGLQRLATCEYTWNAREAGVRPGTDSWAMANDRSSEAFTRVLPRLVRHVFGRREADAVVRAVSEDVHPPWIFFQSAAAFDVAEPREVNLYGKEADYYDLFPDVIRTLGREAESAARAAADIDGAWARREPPGSDPEAEPRLVCLREYFHSARWAAALGAEVRTALAAAAAGRAAEARAALDRARARHAEARAALAALVAERPPSCADLRHPFSADRTLAMLGGQSPTSAPLAAAARHMDTLLRHAGIPEAVLRTLARRRSVSALKVAAPPALDGVLDDQAWTSAHPIETLFVLGAGTSVATASTRALFAYDDEALYLGLDCRVPEGVRVNDDDKVEVYLQPDAKRPDTVLLILPANGALKRFRRGPGPVDLVPEATGGIEARVTRQADGWRGEWRAPWSALGGAPSPAWRCCLARGCKGMLPPEWSAIFPTEPGQGSNLLNLERQFRPLLWTEDPFVRAVTLRVIAPAVRILTLDDSIASVASFGVQVTANTELNHAALEAETLDAEGRVLARRTLAAIGPIAYQWASPNAFDLPFGQQAAARGTLRLTLNCDQGAFTALHAW